MTVNNAKDHDVLKCMHTVNLMRSIQSPFDWEEQTNKINVHHKDQDLTACIIISAHGRPKHMKD